MVRQNMIKQKQAYMPNKWWYAAALLPALGAAFFFVIGGWLGLLLLSFSAVILLCGRGKQLDKRTEVKLR